MNTALFAQAAPVTEAGSVYLREGLLGATCVVLAVVVVALWRWAASKDSKIEALQAARVADQQTMAAAREADLRATNAALLQDKANTVVALTNATNAMQAQADAAGELKTAFRDLSDDLRRDRSRGRQG